VLAGGVAYDFNILFTGILGNASLALDVLNPPEPARGMLESVIQASERAADLTRQLLAYAGKGRLFVRPVDISTLVREIGELMHSSMPKKVRFSLDLADNLPPVEADATQIQQLVMNLVLNAGEAVGESAGTVHVVTRLETRSLNGASNAAARRHVCIEVRDNGCGMDEATRAQIFDPFFSTKFTGRGLGLYYFSTPRSSDCGGAGHLPQPSGTDRCGNFSRRRQHVPRLAPRSRNGRIRSGCSHRRAPRACGPRRSRCRPRH
jgi:signal transduction histidine kinase